MRKILVIYLLVNLIFIYPSMARASYTSSTPDSDFPQTNGTVHAMALSEDGNTLYIGGEFTNVGGMDRNYLAAIDTQTKQVTNWDPSADSTVYAMAVSGTNIFVGGAFSFVGGQDRSEFAKLNNTSGDADTLCNPNVYTASIPTTVYTIKTADNYIYLGGSFTNVGGVGGPARNGLARLNNNTTCTLDSWDPQPDGTIYAIEVLNSDVFVGGAFANIGGQSRSEFAKLNNTNGNADTLCNPNVYTDSVPTTVYAIKTADNYIYLGGSFTNVGGVGGPARNGLARLSNNGMCTLESWSPQPNGVVKAIELVGDNVYVGGGFSSINETQRNRMAMLSASDGSVNLSFDPNMQNPADTVYAIKANGNYVIASGAFNTVGGVERRNLAAFVVDSAAPQIDLNPLSPDPNEDTTPTFSGTVTESVGTVDSVEYQIDSTTGAWSACNLDEEIVTESFESETFPPEGYEFDGGAEWIQDLEIAYEGVKAATSGTVNDSDNSVMRKTVTVTQNTDLSYYWKVSSQAESDFLIFGLDDDFEVVDSISGEVDWTQVTVSLSAGTHTLEWVYSKDFEGTGGADKGWVDKISYTTTSNDSFTCEVTPDLTAGIHTIYLRATDDHENTTPSGLEASDQFTIGLDSPTPTANPANSGSSSNNACFTPQITQLSMLLGGAGAFTPSRDSSSGDQKVAVVLEPQSFSFDAYLFARQTPIFEFSGLGAPGKAFKVGGENGVLGVPGGRGETLWQIGKVQEIWYKTYPPTGKDPAKIIPSLQTKPSIVVLGYTPQDLIIPSEPTKSFKEPSLKLAHSLEGVSWKILSNSVVDAANHTVAAVTTVGGYYMIVGGW